MKKEWQVIHECNDDNGRPTCWSLEISHNKYGKYVWITSSDNGYDVEIDYDGFKILTTCKNLRSAKRWVTMNILNK